MSTGIWKITVLEIQFFPIFYFSVSEWKIELTSATRTDHSGFFFRARPLRRVTPPQLIKDIHLTENEMCVSVRALLRLPWPRHQSFWSRSNLPPRRSRLLFTDKHQRMRIWWLCIPAVVYQLPLNTPLAPHDPHYSPLPVCLPCSAVPNGWFMCISRLMTARPLEAAAASGQRRLPPHTKNPFPRGSVTNVCLTK